MKAYIFPGQGSQFRGMGLDLYKNGPAAAKKLFEQADRILGFELTKIMFEGTDEQLKQTNVTQPAIFLHSVALAKTVADFSADGFAVSMVAGHSLGEFSALVAAGALSFEDGLRLVSQRAEAMQRACEMNPSTMAAVLGLNDAAIIQICAEVGSSYGEVVVAANFNCPGQVVISGTEEGIQLAGEKLKEAGAKRVLPLQVGGAFHSPMMEPAREELAEAIADTPFSRPRCPIYQNVNGQPATAIQTIKSNLIAQLTAPVRWTQSIEAMTADGATLFVECGPGKVLQGLVKKIAPSVETAGV